MTKESEGKALFLDKTYILDILGFDKSRWNDRLPSINELKFCLDIMLRTIEACLLGKYSEFDALTTTNCCHGTALLVRNLINIAHQLDLKQFRFLLMKYLNGPEVSNSFCYLDLLLPSSLIELSKLYILAYIRDKGLERESRTVAKKLVDFAPFSNSFCIKVVFNLQRQISNLVSSSYLTYLDQIHSRIFMHKQPIEMWGKYVLGEYLRMDDRGRIYTACLFSMQIALAYIIHTKTKLLLLTDWKDALRNTIERGAILFQGDGRSQLKPILNEPFELEKFSNEKETVIVFSGYVRSDLTDKESHGLRMRYWYSNLPGLILACDTHYPQFPEVRDDANFNSQPIIPEEEELRCLIVEHAKIPGVSINDPSLFCLAHIYPISLHQALRQLREGGSHVLSDCYIAESLFFSNCEGVP